MRYCTAWVPVLLVAGCAAALAASPAAKPAAAPGVRLELAVNPRLAPFAELLETPAYAAMALENSGYALTMSAKPKILKEGRAVRVKYATLSFQRREGLRFDYQAEIDASIGIATTRIAIPVTVDATDLARGKLAVALHPPMAGILPEELVERIQLRAQHMASPSLQESVAAYLERLAGGSGFSGKVSALFVPLLSDSYNMEIKAAPPSGREPGDAEPVSDQLALIATLLIWLVAVPLAVALRARWAKRHGNDVARGM
ncbi:MAG: hypothetical protein WAO95_01080 [Burkholderiales bacterium]